MGDSKPQSRKHDYSEDEEDEDFARDNEDNELIDRS